ncbi:low-affinity Fe(2+) transport protein [Trebouxia sp. C0009 RCD-2024]
MQNYLDSAVGKSQSHEGDPLKKPDNDAGNPRSRVWSLYHKFSAVLLNTLALFAGSTATFALVCVLIIAWAVGGVFVHDNDIWQISMQDVSSIGCYMWDITLLFAQQKDNQELSELLSHLQASGARQAKLMQLLQKAEALGKPVAHPYTAIKLEPDPHHPHMDFKSLPHKSWYDSLADKASVVAGSPFAQAIYAAGIILWLAYGPRMGFDDAWQLDVNTATAVELMLMTTFLQNTKGRHRLYMHRCIRLISLIDDETEARLDAAALENQIIEYGSRNVDNLPCLVGSRAHSKASSVAYTCVNTYAKFMGSIGGITLSLLLLGLWLGLGKVMGYDNSNWWLIIGTYTGLAGFIDAFVLRNVMKRQSMHLLTHCDLLDISDAKVGSLLNLPSIPAPLCPKGGCCHRVSVRMGQAAAHIATVFLAVAVVVGLLITATAMAWTQTAQLLCNTPTMIVEGAILLVLMMAHMSGHQYMRARLQTFLERRLAIQFALDQGHVN